MAHTHIRSVSGKKKKGVLNYICLVIYKPFYLEADICWVLSLQLLPHVEADLLAVVDPLQLFLIAIVVCGGTQWVQAGGGGTILSQ